MSTLLYYGPGAKDHALNESHKRGRLLEPVYGADGLKTDEARKVVEVLNQTPVGDSKGVVLVGPMDLAHPKASDVLLKSLEDFNDKVVQPILWAEDIGNVTPTIRSRCLSYWCYAQVDFPYELQESSMILLEAYLEKDVKVLVDKLKEHKNNLRELLNVVILFLSQNLLKDSKFVDLWFSLRKVLGLHEPSYTEVLSSFLPMRITL